MSAFPTTKIQRAINALGPDLSDVMFAMCDRYSQGCATGMPMTLNKLGVACQGARIVDENGLEIQVKLDIVAVLPAGAGQIAMQDLADQLVMIDAETAPEAIMQLARFKATRQLSEEKRKQIEADIKVVTRRVVFREALLARVRELEANEPREEDYVNRQEALQSVCEHIAELEITREHVLADGDAELAKLIDKELTSLREKLPPSHDMDHRRSQIKKVQLKSQVALFDGAEEEMRRLHEESAKLLAECASAIEPAMPKLLHWNKSITEVRKAVASGWPTAVALCAGESSVKTLAKHRNVLAEACSGRMLSAHPSGRVLLNVIAETTPAAFVRDMRAIGAEGAAALGATFVIAADTQSPEFGIAKKPADRECLAAFDNRIKEMVIANVRAMLADGFEPRRILVSPEAASLAAAKHDELRTMRVANPLHPALDAFLMRARAAFYVIAGLLYLWRRETGPLSLSTMEDAIDVGYYMIEQFELTVAMAREVPAEEIDAKALFQALCGYVDQQMEKSKAEPKPKPKPFEIKLSTLHSKAKNFGLTRARVNGALKILLVWNWIKARQEGLDTVFDLDSHRFSSMNRPF